MDLLVFLRVSIVSNRVVRRDGQQIIRPLLGLSRCDAMKLCKNWDLPVYPDATNEKLQFLRNRLRKQLFPLLRCLFNPRFDKSLFQCAELLLQEQLHTETVLLKLRAGAQLNLSLMPTSRLKAPHYLFLPKMGSYFLHSSLTSIYASKDCTLVQCSKRDGSSASADVPHYYFLS